MEDQKPSLTGFEIELFIADSNGNIIDAADALIKQARKDGHTSIKKESSSSMVEIASLPNEKVPHSMAHLLDELEYLIDIAKSKNALLVPLASYPGRFSPTMRKDKLYRVKESILGKKRFPISGRCSGFHCHYTLPTGIFDEQLRILKVIAHQKIKDALVNSYNLMVAADPALTCFMQSSPYYQGKFIGKDSRLIMYRGGESLDNSSGLYAKFQEFGGLPHYKMTVFDMEEIISSNFEKWKSYIKGFGFNIKTLSMYGSVLDLTWAPVKINPNGTLEQRGMDMNHPIFIASIGVIIKFLLKRLQEEYYTVVPSEIGIEEPFKVEKDVIYIPPFSYVKNVLQKLSAYNGLESDTMLKYCKALLSLAKSTIPKEGVRMTDPVSKLLARRSTISDDILDFVRRKGCDTNKISNRLAAEIALEHSKRLVKEIKESRRLIKNLI